MDRIFLENDNFKKLYTCFMELAKEEKQKDAITQIMQTGEYNGFKANSMISNQSYNEKEERARRIYYADMILQNKDLFFELAKNGLNVFHGTKIDALETILSFGLHNSSELDNKGIELKTGEELAMNNHPNIWSVEKREFVSLTDNYHTAVHYAGFPNEEIDLLAKQYGIMPKDDTPIILCFNGESIKQNYSQSIVNVSSTCNEIGITSSINPSEIKYIITTHDTTTQLYTYILHMIN